MIYPAGIVDIDREMDAKDERKKEREERKRKRNAGWGRGRKRKRVFKAERDELGRFVKREKVKGEKCGEEWNGEVNVEPEAREGEVHKWMRTHTPVQADLVREAIEEKLEAELERELARGLEEMVEQPREESREGREESEEPTEEVIRRRRELGER